MSENFLKKLIPSFLVGFYHFAWAFLGALIYRFPSRRLKVIGVTGTHGKTTVVDLATQILEQAGFKTACSCSIKFRIAEKEKENRLKMTMPGRGLLQKFLREAVNKGCKYAVLEVTSEGVLQHRHRFIRFDTMVFTNLFKEHIEHHGSFENYKKAKSAYFKKCKGMHIINIDDENAEYFLNFPSRQKFCFGLDELKIEKLKIDWKLKIENWKFIKATQAQETESGVNFKIDEMLFSLKLLGGFNVYNALAAISVALSQGVSLEICKKALERAKGIPGRMEEVILEPFRVVVDYAFTPDALQQVYQTLINNSQNLTTNNQQLITERKLVCVLGACGGGRDKWKRPILGEIAAKHCREVIITNEDPYDENPMEIINQIAKGVVEGTRFLRRQVFKVLDRREAIRKALELAKPGDTVIITGKGCEPWICVEKGKKIPWDDRKVVREEFQKLKLN